MKKILIIHLRNIRTAPRVIRTIEALKDTYLITTASFDEYGFNGIEHIQLNMIVSDHRKHWNAAWPLRKFRSLKIKLYHYFSFLYKDHYYENELWPVSFRDQCDLRITKKYDLVIAHHWDALPIAVSIKKKDKSNIIFNAHDYYERQFDSEESWVKNRQPLVKFIMKKYVGQVDIVFAAWEKIARDYKENYNVETLVVGNESAYWDLQPTQPDDKIKLIHHGIANENRNLDLMFDMMEVLDERFELYLMLIHNEYNQSYFNKLKERAERTDRIYFIDPVATEKIPARINEFDIGVFILPPVYFNAEYCVPNKLYEFIQARLAVVVGPSKGFRNIVSDNKTGLVLKDFTAETAGIALNKITNTDLVEYKKNASSAAQKLKGESNYPIIQQAVSGLIG
jgi:glycosyltransferase involved in cell wall biosynthesis